MVWNPTSVIPTLSWWNQIAIILIISVLIAISIKLGGVHYIRRNEERDNNAVLQMLVEELHGALYRTVLFLGIYTSAQLLARAWVVFLISALALTALIFQWSWTLGKLGVRSLDVMKSGRRSANFAPVMRNIWKIAIFSIGFLIALSVWRVDITPLLASAGIIGIIVAVAAQGTISNVFAGIALSFDQTYKVGDVLTLRSGERGTVTDISLRSTTLLTRDNITITIPNSNLNEQRITNESAPRRPRRIRLPIGVAYTSDLEHVRDILFDVSDQVEYVLDDPKPEVKFRAFGNSAIELEYMCTIRNPNLRGRTIDALIREIHKRFDEEEVKIPFPQRELSFLNSEDSLGSGMSSHRTVPGGTSADRND